MCILAALGWINNITEILASRLSQLPTRPMATMERIGTTASPKTMTSTWSGVFRNLDQWGGDSHRFLPCWIRLRAFIARCCTCRAKTVGGRHTDSLLGDRAWRSFSVDCDAEHPGGTYDSFDARSVSGSLTALLLNILTIKRASASGLWSKSPLWPRRWRQALEPSVSLRPRWL